MQRKAIQCLTLSPVSRQFYIPSNRLSVILSHLLWVQRGTWIYSDWLRGLNIKLLGRWTYLSSKNLSKMYRVIINLKVKRTPLSKVWRLTFHDLYEMLSKQFHGERALSSMDTPWCWGVQLASLSMDLTFHKTDYLSAVSLY